MILIVEDDADARSLLTLFFHMYGQPTVASGSALDAIQLLQTHTPRAILLDYHMPGMDGLQFLEILKGDERYRHIPVYIVSGDMRLNGPSLLQKGAQGFFYKGSFDWSDLVREVMRVVA